MIFVNPYKDFDGLLFDSLESEAIKHFGVPIKCEADDKSGNELHYSEFILRFDPVRQGLRECTLLPKCSAVIDRYPLAWDSGFLHALMLEDPNMLEAHGFVVSLRFGLALTGFHDGDVDQMAVHAFRHGNWDARIGRMKRFLF